MHSPCCFCLFRDPCWRVLLVEGRGQMTGCDFGCVTFTIIYKPPVSHVEAGPLSAGKAYGRFMCDNLRCMCVCVCACVCVGGNKELWEGDLCQRGPWTQKNRAGGLSCTLCLLPVRCPSPPLSPYPLISLVLSSLTLPPLSSECFSSTSFLFFFFLTYFTLYESL